MVYCRRMPATNAVPTYVLISAATGHTYGYPYPRVFSSKEAAQQQAERLNSWWVVAQQEADATVTDNA